MSQPTNLRGTISETANLSLTIRRLAGEISYAITGSMAASPGVGAEVAKPFGGIMEEACESNQTLHEAANILDGVLSMLMPQTVPDTMRAADAQRNY